MSSKQEQKQHLIDIMKSDEELGLYNTEVDNFEIIKPLFSKRPPKKERPQRRPESK